jgi:hypothetical protein
LALGKPFDEIFGPNSNEFNLLRFYETLDLGVGDNAAKAFKVAANAQQGWATSAAGPERIFSRAGLMCSALRNRFSTWILELVVFVFKNKEFLPTVDEVVSEI